MNKDLRELACLNVKNYISQRDKEVRFLALGTHKPIDSKDSIQQQLSLTTLQSRFSRLTPVRCERLNNSRPLDTVYLNEETIWKFVYSENWNGGSSLRICEGDLLRRLLEELNSLLANGHLVFYKRARFDSACFTVKPTAIKHSNLYRKNMLPEIVKISFCYYALNKNRLEANLTELSYSVSDSLFKVSNEHDEEESPREGSSNDMVKENKKILARGEIHPQSLELKDGKRDMTIDRHYDQTMEQIHDIHGSKSSEKSMVTNNDPENIYIYDTSVQASKYSIQTSTSKNFDIETDSNVTRSETAMSVRQKSKLPRLEARKRNNYATLKGNAQANRGGTLEFDQNGKPKFKPSHETIVNVAAFKFNRCSSDSDDSDCDRIHGKQVVQTIKRKKKKFTKKNLKKKLERIRDPFLKETIDKNENYVPSDSDEDQHWLNGVPQVPQRHDVKSLMDYLKSKRKLKYGRNENLFACRNISDYIPARIPSGKSYRTVTNSTHGMSYFNPYYQHEEHEVELVKLFYSGTSLAKVRSTDLDSSNSSDITEIKKCSFEAICGSENTTTATKSLESLRSDRDEDYHRSSKSSSLNLNPEEQGIMHLINLDLVSSIKPNYSHDRLLRLKHNQHTVEENHRNRFSRDAPLKRIEKIMQKGEAAKSGKIQNATSSLYKIEADQYKQHHEKNLRNQYDSNHFNRPTDGMYKSVRKHGNAPNYYQKNLSPPIGILEEPTPELFKQEIHRDIGSNILQLVQDFIVTKEVVSRQAGKIPIISITITRPIRNRYGTKYDVEADIN